MSRARASWLVVVALASAVALFLAAAGSGAEGDVGWRGWGNTPDNQRYSPLTLIDKDNVDQLGRIFTVNFRTLDPIARLGQQSYPVVVGDRMYVTTGEGKTYALDATSGRVIWKWYPDQIAVFNKAGIVANRGVAVCDGKVFVLNIDMTITMLNQQTGDVIKRVAISSAVARCGTGHRARDRHALDHVARLLVEHRDRHVDVEDEHLAVADGDAAVGDDARLVEDGDLVGYHFQITLPVVASRA